MIVELSLHEIDVLLEAIEYSRQSKRDAQGTPYSVRQENLRLLDEVASRFREARRRSYA